MKKCPKCKQIFSEDYSFCLEDGTTLVAVAAEEDSMPTVTVNEAEMETQVLPAQTIDPNAQTVPNQNVYPTDPTINPAGHSKWLYILLGVMATLVIVLGTAFYLNQTGGGGETANSKPGGSVFNPSGKWTGQWTSEKGGLSDAEVTLNDDGANQISGFIEWTLRKSVNPNKKDKTGMKAIEYVQGTYDPLTRVISVTGYKKKDPNDLIVLDSYKLTLSEDNNILRGSTRNQGKWSGKLNLKRTE